MLICQSRLADSTLMPAKEGKPEPGVGKARLEECWTRTHRRRWEWGQLGGVTQAGTGSI